MHAFSQRISEVWRRSESMYAGSILACILQEPYTISAPLYTKNEIPPESITGFVTCLHEENWWLACVLEVCSDTKEVKLTFLHPPGPSNSFKYPEPQNTHTIPMVDILTLVDPRTRSGRVYSLTIKEMTFATEQLRTVSPQ